MHIKCLIESYILDTPKLDNIRLTRLLVVVNVIIFKHTVY